MNNKLYALLVLAIFSINAEVEVLDKKSSAETSFESLSPAILTAQDKALLDVLSALEQPVPTKVKRFLVNSGSFFAGLLLGIGSEFILEQNYPFDAQTPGKRFCMRFALLMVKGIFADPVFEKLVKKGYNQSLPAYVVGQALANISGSLLPLQNAFSKDPAVFALLKRNFTKDVLWEEFWLGLNLMGAKINIDVLWKNKIDQNWANDYSKA